MGIITGERTVEIAASAQRCWDIAADVENAPEWQGSLKTVDVLERDAEGRPWHVDTENDATVRTVKSRLHFTYDPPTGIEWIQEKGDVKAVRGWWRFEELAADRTRATYGLEVDPGMVLGLLLRGPAEAKVRDHLLAGAAEGLKARAEG